MASPGNILLSFRYVRKIEPELLRCRGGRLISLEIGLLLLVVCMLKHVRNTKEILLTYWVKIMKTLQALFKVKDPTSYRMHARGAICLDL
jgi:hypothetical protein